MKSPGLTADQQQQYADRMAGFATPPLLNPGAGQPNPLQQMFDAAQQARGPASIADSGRNAADAMTAAEHGHIPTLDFAPPRPGGAGDLLGQMLRDPQKRQALLAVFGGD